MPNCKISLNTHIFVVTTVIQSYSSICGIIEYLSPKGPGKSLSQVASKHVLKTRGFRSQRDGNEQGLSSSPNQGARISSPLYVGFAYKILYLFCLFVCFLVFLGLHPRHMEVPQARGRIGAVATSLCQSHSNARSEPHLQPTPQLMAMPDS